MRPNFIEHYLGYDEANSSFDEAIKNVSLYAQTRGYPKLVESKIIEWHDAAKSAWGKFSK